MAGPARATRDRELGDRRLARSLSRLPYRRAQQQDQGRPARELELRLHLRAVEGPRRDDRVAVPGEAEDVARESGSELRRHGGPEPHAVDGESEQGHVRLPLRHERLQRRLGRVGLELLRVDPNRDDLVHSGQIRRLGERSRIAGDNGDGHRAAELDGRGHELAGDVAEPALQVLGHDENPAHDSRAFTISAMRAATAAGVVAERLCTLAPRGHEHAAHPVRSLAADRAVQDDDLLLVGLLDGTKGGVARFVDPGLDREKRRCVHLHDVDEPALELAVDDRPVGAVVVLEPRHDRHLGQVQQMRQASCR